MKPQSALAFAYASSDADRCAQVAQAGSARGTRCMLVAHESHVHCYGTCDYERTPEQRANRRRYITGIDRQ